MFLVPMTRQSADLARSFDRLFDDGLFDRLLAPTRADNSSTARNPALEVAETDSGYSVKLDLPGVSKDGVKISIDGRRVNVEASAVSNTEKQDGERIVYSERSLASYARSFTLPAEVEQAESSAKMENGVLTLQLAKRGANKAAQLTVS